MHKFRFLVKTARNLLFLAMARLSRAANLLFLISFVLFLAMARFVAAANLLLSN